MMILLCKTNLAKDLPSPTLKARYGDHTVFDLLCGKKYLAYSMSLWVNDLYVSLSDENDLPNWYPLVLFSVHRSLIASDWHFSCFANDGQLRALWGYAQMITDEKHYDALIERDEDAITKFLNEKLRRGSLEGDSLE